MRQLTIPGLAKNEAAFELDSGDAIVVTITRRSDAQPGFALLQIDTEVIDPETLATRYVLAPHEDAVQLAALATPTAMQETVAFIYELAERRASDFMAAQTVIVDFPMTPTPGEPVTRDRTSDAASSALAPKSGGA